jgi:hypothetical protein
MSEGKFEQFIFQPDLEEEIKKESSETKNILGELEREKRSESSNDVTESDGEKVSENLKDIKKRKQKKSLKKDTLNFIEKHGVITKKEKKHTGRGIDSVRHPKNEDVAKSEYEQLQEELKSHGISDPKEWHKALDLETPLNNEDEIESSDGRHEKVELKNFEAIFTYLEGGLRISDRLKIEKFGNTKNSIERLQLLSNMSASEAAQCIYEFGLNGGAYYYLSQRLDFYQKLIQGKAVKRYHTQKWDSKKNEYVDVVEEEPIDASYISSDNIRLGLWRDTLYAAMQGTPEMGAIKVATRRINRKLEEKAENSGSSGQSTKIKSVVELFGYYSGIWQGSIGQYSDLGNLYKQCFVQAQRWHQEEKITDEQLEHIAVRLMAKKLEGAYEYSGVINTSDSPYNPGFKEAITVGQLGHDVMRQMRGMRNKIQETNFRNVERFIGKSGNNRYGFEKKRLNNDVKALDDFIQDNKGYDAFYWQVKNDDGTKKQIKGKEAVDLMTQQKNSEAIQRAKWWFEKEAAKINKWFEKSNLKIAEYDISEEERMSIYASVQERYNNKLADLQSEYQREVARLENRTPEELLEMLKERQDIVNKRFEKRKSLAQKALDLHFRFNHEGRDYGSKPFDQIDWINDAPFGVIKRAHRALSAGADDQAIMMRALAEVNGEPANDQNPEKFILNILKSGRPDKVIQNFEKFSGITEGQHLSILLAMIGSGAGRDVVENLNKFTGITLDDHLQIVQALNVSNAGETVVTNIETFSGIKHEDKRDVLIGAIKGGGGYQFAQNFEKFSDVFSEKDHPEVVHELSQAGAGAAVIDNFQKFNGIPVEEHRDMVLEAIRGGGSYQVIQNLEKFRGVTEKDHRDIVLEIIKSGGGGYYLTNALDKFKGLEEGLIQVIKAGKHEALPHVLNAGFTIEEITRFPFLISQLVTKK